MTRNFVSFIRFVVFVVVVSFGTLSVVGCSNSSPTSPTPPGGGGSGGQGVVMPPPGSPELTDVPSDWVQMVTYDGEPFPAKARVLYLSPEPGTKVVRGVIQNCAQFPNTCLQRKFEVCLDTSQYTWAGADQGGIPFDAYFSNSKGGFGRGLSLGNIMSGPDANGCWVFDYTLEGTGGSFSPFPPSDVADCCQWINVVSGPSVRRIGESWDTDDQDPIAYAAFFVYYQ